VLHIGSGSTDGSSPALTKTAQNLRRHNVDRIRSLSLGMTVGEVESRMGNEASWLGGGIGWVDSPYRTESYTDSNGQPILVYYYYTRLRERDNIIADDVLTPVGFRNGRLLGWGQSFLSRTIEEF